MSEQVGKIFTRRMLETALASALDMVCESLTPPAVYEVSRNDVKAIANNVFVLGGIATDISELEAGQ